MDKMWDIRKVHKITKTRFDEEGYDIFGYNKDGFNRKGYHGKTGKKYDPNGFDVNGINKDGFNRKGIHKDTNDIYDPKGYDIYGFNKKGKHKETNLPINSAGFYKNGIHYKTKEIYDPEGYDRNGYDIDGYDRDGFSKNGFNYRGSHYASRSRYLAPDGYNRYGYDRYGYNRYGYNRRGYDKWGFDREGIHKDTKDKYDKSGYDKDGYDRDGYDKDGYDKDGVDRLGFDREKLSIDTGETRNLKGYTREEILVKEQNEKVKLVNDFLNSEMTIPKFLKTLETKMDEDQFNKILREFKDDPEYSEKIEQTLKRNSDRYIGVHVKQKDLLLKGEMDIKDINNLDLVLRMCSDTEKEIIIKNFGRMMLEHSINLMQYACILGIKGKLDTAFPKAVIDKLNRIKNELIYKIKSPDISVKELYLEIHRMEQYKQPYRTRVGDSIGFIENPVDPKSKIRMMTITTEIEEAAKKYVKLTGDFVCQYTVSPVLSKIAKGELTMDDIQRMIQENRSRKQISGQDIGQATFDILPDTELCDDANKTVRQEVLNIEEKNANGIGENK